MLQTRRIGIVPSSNGPMPAAGASPTGFSLALKILEEAQTTLALPIEVISLSETPTRERLEAWSREFAALVLDDRISDEILISAEAAGAVQTSPFLESGAKKSSLLIWPEAIFQFTSVHSGWLRTSFAAASAFDAAAQAARFAAHDREGTPVYWVQTETSARDSEMRERVQSVLSDRRLAVIPDHELLASTQAGQATGRVLMADPIHAPMLARMLGAHARMTTFDPGVHILKLSRPHLPSARLGVATLLDRLGFVSQAQTL